MKASWGWWNSVTFNNPIAERELLKFEILSSEKSLDWVLTGLITVFEELIKLRTGKWSERLETKIIDSNLSETWLVIIWSIVVAELGVHLVGLVTICKRPWEKRRSIYSVELGEELYFRQSIFVSPKM